MPQMSPLLRILMRILRAASWVAGALILLFAALLLYQRRTPDGGLALENADYGFFAVLVALFLLAVYLVRGIRKELDGPGG